jgi:P-type Cu+ transporter
MSRTAIACVAALSLAACTPTLTRHLRPQDDPSSPDAPEATWHPPALPQPLERAAPSSASAYTCPMHPEVISDHPGRCPKCSMALVPKQEQP